MLQTKVRMPGIVKTSALVSVLFLGTTACKTRSYNKESAAQESRAEVGGPLAVKDMKQAARLVVDVLKQTQGMRNFKVVVKDGAAQTPSRRNRPFIVLTEPAAQSTWTIVLPQNETEPARAALEARVRLVQTLAALDLGLVHPDEAVGLAESSSKTNLSNNKIADNLVALGVKAGTHFASRSTWIELSVNEVRNDAQSTLDLATYFGNILNLMAEPSRDAVLASFAKEEAGRLDLVVGQLAPLARESAREANEKDAVHERRRKVLDFSRLKFEDAVAAGQRELAARIISTYLPWHKLGPVEKTYWRRTLEGMRRPLQGAKGLLVYRGEDRNNRLIGGTTPSGGKVEFIASKSMESGQGSYNYRLRTLRAMSDPSGASTMMSGKRVSSFWTYDFPTGTGQKVRALTHAMKRHAFEPLGSVFLSTSVNPSVVAVFCTESCRALVVDERRALPNPGGFDFESEVLVGNVIFPDEVVNVSGNIELGKDATHLRSGIEPSKLKDVTIVSEFDAKAWAESRIDAFFKDALATDHPAEILEPIDHVEEVLRLIGAGEVTSQAVHSAEEKIPKK